MLRLCGLTAHFFLRLKTSCNLPNALEKLKKEATFRAQLLAKCEGSTLVLLDEGGFWTCGLLLFAALRLLGALLLLGAATGVGAIVDVALTLAVLAVFASIAFVKAVSGEGA